ncbi:ERCC4-like protein, partial [Mitosporidium daphniae]
SLNYSGRHSFLKEVLVKGVEKTFASSLKKYKAWKDRLPSMAWEYNPVTKQPRIVDLEAIDKDEQGNEDEICPDKILEQICDFELPDIQIHCFSFENVSRFCSGLLLEFIKPTHIILCDIDLAFLRTIELYQWSRLSSALSMSLDTEKGLEPPPLFVSVFQQEGSAQEHRYLINLRAEADAFTSLLKIEVKFPLTTTTDIEGALAKVYVDTREFRSILPSLLHSSGRFDICPMMLSIGDYVIQRKLGHSSLIQLFVERKSLSDLVGSLTNGRLYDQTRAMVRVTSRPFLLLELGASVPDDSSDTLQTNLRLFKGKSSQEISVNDVPSKLVILLLHFPTLRLLWSLEPIYSIEHFNRLASIDLFGTPFSQHQMVGHFLHDEMAESEYERDLTGELISDSLQDALYVLQDSGLIDTFSLTAKHPTLRSLILQCEDSFFKQPLLVELNR